MPNWVRKIRPWMNIILALGALAVFILTIGQLVFLRSAENAAGSMPVSASTTNPDVPVRRGLYVQMSDGSFNELLPVTESRLAAPLGVANFAPGTVKWIVVSGSIYLNDSKQYRIYKLYRDGDGSDELPVKLEKVEIGADKVVRFAPVSGSFAPGAYLIDTPTDSMIGGRTYAYFILGDWVTPVVGNE